MELNREQIIKALECCADGAGECDDCPLIHDNFCGKHLLRNALSLIKELTEERKDFEIRALRAENEAAMYKDRWETSRKDFERLADDNERLRGCVKSKEEVEAIMRATYELLAKEITKEQIDKAVADTVRKMQERLNEAFNSHSDNCRDCIKSKVNQIADELIKQ